MRLTLLSIVGKNLKIFFRSKTSAISIILIPLLIIIFAGTAFDSSALSNVQIGVYPQITGDLESNIIKEFENNNFTVEYYTTEEDCIESVKLSLSQICVSFEDVDKITFHIDDSRVNLADVLINNVKSSANKEASNIGGILAQNLIDLLDETKNNIPKSQNKLKDTLELAEKSKNSIRNIDLSSEDITSVITQLEDAKETVNNSNTESKIISAIAELEEIKTKNDEISEKISSASDSSSEVEKEIQNNIDDLDNILSELESEDIISAEKIVSPFDIQVKPINSSSKKKDNLIPTLLSLIALFGATLLSSTFVMKAKKSKAYFRNFITPVKDITFVMGTYFTCLIILLIQFIIIFTGIKFVLKMDVFAMPLELISAILVSLTVFIFIGMFIGYLFRSEETIIFASVIFSAILMFFSNTILPLENISKDLMKFASLNPLVISDSLFKKIILFGIDFSNLSKEFLCMGILAVFFLILTYIFRRTTRRMQ